MLRKHRGAIGKIYLVAGLSLLLLTGSFYLFGFKPLSDRLHFEHAFEMEHFLHSNLWLIQSVINKHYDLSRQSASRTAIRKKQAAYLRGEVSREELVAFSVPKLGDALRANDDIAGIARFDPAGKLLFNVGQQLPEGIAERCVLAKLEAIRMLSPTQIGDKRRLLYCTPIVDRDGRRVGADILIMKEDAIQQIIDDPQGYDNTVITAGVASDGSIIYWPGKQNELPARGVLENFIKTGATQGGYLIISKEMKNNGWLLYTVVNEELFFADINRQLMLLLSVIVGVAILLFVLTMVVLQPIIRTLLKEQQLFEQSHRDGLTGLYNHTYMQELLDRELSRAQRHKRPLSILMFDLDHFKHINDTYGHLAGDDMLQNIARVVQRSARKEDMAARYGVEEFMLILPETDKEEASIMAERLRSDVASTRIATDAGELGITISIGVVSYDSYGSEITKRNIIRTADKAMYISKNGGRNRVTVVDLPA
ncbi:GGDEF domain-containing protein [Sulfuriflexus sp.]|uniref:GGDEF domain-containing protein n=1 Tax=Sulfuriflexus sp. TaxID=2015443 RepID=UPI0028CFB287|nr:GGDEF domain-containing protein [Sulfuriflexus sp.]MDT8405559.1 GGDEF domain-containing protein [Sulfuriflexus sp.]